MAQKNACVAGISSPKSIHDYRKFIRTQGNTLEIIEGEKIRVNPAEARYMERVK